MILSSHQSSFFPWIGYWAKISQSDVHVVSGHVEFNPRNYQNRVEIYGSLRTLPVLKNHTPRPYINEVRYDVATLDKMLEGLRKELLGKKCKNPEAVRNLLDAAYRFNNGWLIDVNLSVLDEGRRLFGIETQWRQDGFDCGRLTKTARLVERTNMKTFAVTKAPLTYLAGSGQRAYLNPSELPEGVSVVYQDLPEGLPSCSILELLHRLDKNEIVQLFAQIGDATGVEVRCDLSTLG